MHMVRTLVASWLVLAAVGCKVETNNNRQGRKDVDISTPLGGMSVKTDSAAVQAKLGLPVYPGAVPEKKKGDDSSSADVDMSFGSFHLRVLAMGFDSTDAPDKITTFYRKELSQYSDVILCRNKQPVGTPTRTGLGLTCADDNHVHAHTGINSDDDETQLKAGSPSRQHIVSFKPSGSGTHFGLISLELPRGEDKGA